MAARTPPELDPDDGVFVIDVRTWPADAVSVDAIARIALGARRRGGATRLRHVSPQLACLLAFCGLAEVAGLRLEPQRQPEQREQALGTEERVDRHDGAA